METRAASWRSVSLENRPAPRHTLL